MRVPGKNRISEREDFYGDRQSSKEDFAEEIVFALHDEGLRKKDGNLRGQVSEAVGGQQEGSENTGNIWIFLEYDGVREEGQRLSWKGSQLHTEALNIVFEDFFEFYLILMEK